MTGAGAALPPGSTIGILGSGQLGRMLALAAARLGLKCHVYSDVAGAPACDVAAHSTNATYEDRAALAVFAATVDAVTYEFENIPVDTVEVLAATRPVHPSAEALRATQDRLVEKRFVAGLGVPVAPFAEVSDLASLRAELETIGPNAHLKTRRFGYDGKGQVRLTEGSDAGAALAAVGGDGPAILEAHVAFDVEISVIAVRALDGTFAAYDIPQNEHRDGILRRSTVPSALPAAVVEEARAHTRRIAEALGYVGVLAVEMFVCNGRAGASLVVNEIAPRVHNSGHWTLDACLVSQFENHMRAVAGWPLGPTERHSDAVMENLIGTEIDDWARLAAEPRTAVHHYGKAEARPGRKMGHVTRLSARRDLESSRVSSNRGKTLNV